jgi:phospholipid/cholesterol/gamma-HCH transport system substrate-binding protein
MNEDARYVVVGLFVAAVAALVVGFAIWLGGRGPGTPQRSYVVAFDHDVTGLVASAPVRYLGVSVGRVTSIAIDPPRVEVRIEVSDETPVTTGTYAMLAAQGITGVPFVNLASEPGEQTPLPAGATIPSRQTGLPALLSEAPAVFERANEVLGRAGAVLDDANREQLGAILRDLGSVSATLAAQREAIGQLPGEALATLRSVRGAVARVEPGMTSAVARLDEVSVHLARISAAADRWLVGDEAAEGFLAGGLGQTPELVAEARATLREIEKLAVALREDPSRLLFQPQAEREAP